MAHAVGKAAIPAAEGAPAAPREAQLLGADARALAPVVSVAAPGEGCSREKPFVTTTTPIRLPSANDGETVIRLDRRGIFDRSDKTRDSITVVDPGLDDPRRVRTAFGVAPCTVFGAPYVAVLPRWSPGFVGSQRPTRREGGIGSGGCESEGSRELT